MVPDFGFGDSEQNNQFRILDATDINDAGVISGTAMKCAGGYSTTANNATCSSDEHHLKSKLNVYRYC